MTLYELKEEYKELLYMAEDPDIDDQVISDTFEAIEGEIEAKAEGYAIVINTVLADIETIKAEEKRLAERRRIFETRVARMRDAVKDAMELVGKSRIDTRLFTVNIRKNPPKLVIDAEEDIPAEYWEVPEPVPVLDKARLKAALTEGLETSYAHLEQGTSLQIR